MFKASDGVETDKVNVLIQVIDAGNQAGPNKFFAQEFFLLCGREDTDTQRFGQIEFAAGACVIVAFDMDKLGENYLCVRRAQEDETLITLDEIESFQPRKLVV